jgi:dephospho-CoA kinase
MKIIGLLGGVASGKSTVAEEFKRLGAAVIDADRAGHEVLRQPAVRAVIGGRWGSAVIGPDGEVDRAALAKIVFAPPPDGPPQLAELERITHPEIAKKLKTEIDDLALQGTKIAILDEFARREAAQEPIAEKKRHVNFVLDNSGDVSYIQEQVQRCWQALLEPAG